MTTHDHNESPARNRGMGAGGFLTLGGSRSFGFGIFLQPFSFTRGGPDPVGKVLEDGCKVLRYCRRPASTFPRSSPPPQPARGTAVRPSATDKKPTRHEVDARAVPHAHRRGLPPGDDPGGRSTN